MGTLFERAAARHPARTLSLDHDLDVAPGFPRRASYAAFAELVADLSARLAAAGVGPGQRVVLHKSHGFDITLLACAIARVGAVPVLLSPKLDGATVDALIRRVDRPYLLTDQRKLEEELPPTVFEQTRGVLLATGRFNGAVELQKLAGSPPVAAHPAAPYDPALITHTSGTTGLPKLAVHTGFTLQSRFRPQDAAARLFVRGRQTIAIHVSFVHSRMFTALSIPLLRGFEIMVLADDDPARVADTFAAQRPTIIEAHPNTFMAWEELADDPRGPLADMQTFSSTFDAIHPRTVQRMLEGSRRRRPRFVQMYGQSEIGPTTIRSYHLGRSREDDLRCVGIPFPGMTGARVVSRGGRKPSRDTPGYIEIRSNGRIVTYLGEEDRYQHQISNGGWWRMGDVGYRGRWGCVHLLDREVDVIEGFGSTLAVEDALFGRIGDLTEVVIIPGPDGRAVPVVCTRNDTPLDLLSWRTATADLPPMAEPVQWRHGDLPQTSTTKIKRLELARLVAARSGA
ncbi:class I adenylate-forming enzyme family protein [Actinoplanes sp. CA-252034]|uniref:class I adenylate-forming enzyme family protein n=1 Tax=Actinoplanes sp. CA-252034 TaxID=3239906 RepID=UPI003D958738